MASAYFVIFCVDEGSAHGARLSPMVFVLSEGSAHGARLGGPVGSETSSREHLEEGLSMSSGRHMVDRSRVGDSLPGLAGGARAAL